MIKADLITGFLGSGKTNFICDYVERLCAEGIKTAVIVKDYGAVNVDRLFLEKRIGRLCHVDMVIAGDADCARRRLKTKLISLAMDHYERVILEPSGIYNADDFLDLIYDDALERWYCPGSIITLVDAGMCGDLGRNARYVLASQAAKAGAIVITKTEKADAGNVLKYDPGKTLSYDELTDLSPGEAGAETEKQLSGNETIALAENSLSANEARAGKMKKAEAYVLACLEEFGCKRKDFIFVEKAGQKLDDEKYKLLKNAGYRSGEMQHLSVTEDGSFESAFFYRDEDIDAAEAADFENNPADDEFRGKEDAFTENVSDKKESCSENDTEKDLISRISVIFSDHSYGLVYRVKGFVKMKEGWLEVNAMKNSTEIAYSDIGQAVFIAIGENLNREKLKEAFDFR